MKTVEELTAELEQYKARLAWLAKCYVEVRDERGMLLFYFDGTNVERCLALIDKEMAENEQP